MFRKKMKLCHTQLNVIPCDLPQNQLPTGGEVVGRIMLLRLKEMRERQVEENRVSIHSIISQVSKEVMAIWQRASVPTKHEYKVRAEISKLWKMKDAIRKSASSVTRLADAGKRMTQLLDIASCSCSPKDDRDRMFLEDQRGARRFVIGGIDKAATEQWQRSEMRKERSGVRLIAKTTAGEGARADRSAASGTSFAFSSPSEKILTGSSARTGVIPNIEYHIPT